MTAPFLGHQLQFGQLLLDAVGVCVLQVDLVDGNDNGHVARLGVGDRLPGLGHDAVICRHHQHDNVRNLGAARPHGRESLVSRGVQKGNPASGRLNLISANMLRNSPGLRCLDIRLANSVEQ